MASRPLHRAFSVFVAVALVLSFAPGIAAAQSGAGGAVVVEEGETVSEVNAVAGSVIIRGTVTGDVSATAGSVYVDGTVGGNLEVATGNLRITGTVDGDVTAAAGDVHLQDGATVGGDFAAGAGTVRIDGQIDGDATVGAETTRLGENASIAGSLTYDGNLTGNRDAVEGEITRDSAVGGGVTSGFQMFATWAFAAYAFVINLIVGAVLLALFPRVSAAVADRAMSAPVRSGLVGLGVAVGVPVLLVAIAITVVGIPISIAGALMFALVAWIGLIYGRFAVGTWLLSLADADNRWLALVIGLLVGAVLTQIPIVGGLLNALVFLLGLGALSSALYYRRRRGRAASSTPSPGDPPSD